MKYNISYICISHKGYCRSINQDNFICDGKYMEQAYLSEYKTEGVISNNMSLLGIFDGMGGEECGEVASYIAAKAATAYPENNKATENLISICKAANEEICSYADINNIEAMGTTAAMLMFSDKVIGICNIGDSKIYRYDGKELKQLSVDHVSVAAYGRKPPLYQNLGIPPSEMIIEPYVSSERYRSNYIYLLCSDGLTDMVDEAGIKEIIANNDIETAANSLLKKALDNGGKDNITIILCKIECKKQPLLKKLFKGE